MNCCSTSTGTARRPRTDADGARGSVAQPGYTGMESSILTLLQAELKREDLRVYCAVVMADRDLDAGDVASALARLRSEADKLRCHDTPSMRCSSHG